MSKPVALGSVVSLSLCFCVAVEARACCLAGDVNGDLQLDMLDLPPFVETLLDPSSADPTAFCAADVNRDSLVDGRDVADFVAVMLDPSLALFDYGPGWPNSEAEQIGLEILGVGGPLLLPERSYGRIERDLGLIRAAFPALATQTHSPAWLPQELLVSIIPGVPSDGYQCLNAYYQVTNIEHLFGDWYVLTFGGHLNVPAVALLYAALPEVQYAEPNGLIGGENFWEPTAFGSGVWEWDVDDGFMDCFDGCDCHRHYLIRTDELGRVTLVLYEEYGMSWCEF